MTTTARRCASCGAPLPEAGAGVSQITCTFCHVVNDLAPSGAVTVHVNRPVPTPRSGGGARLLILVLITSVIVGLGGAGLGVFLRSADRMAQRTPPPAPRRDPGPRPIPPGELNSRPDTGWHQLDVPAPQGDWAAFDPVANLEWARGIGRAWRDDAVLMRVDVKRLTTAGTLNLADGEEDEAGFRFVSPAQIQEWSARAARGEANPSVGYELMITAARKSVKGIVSFGRPWTREVPPDDIASMPPAALIERAKANRKFQESAYYDGYMIHNAREGWVWYFQARGQLEPSPRVRARDGAVYPYRR